MVTSTLHCELIEVMGQDLPVFMFYLPVWCLRHYRSSVKYLLNEWRWLHTLNILNEHNLLSWKDICNLFKLCPQVPISILCAVGIQEINNLKLIVIEYAFHINFHLSLWSLCWKSSPLLFPNELPMENWVSIRPYTMYFTIIVKTLVMKWQALHSIQGKIR